MLWLAAWGLQKQVISAWIWTGLAAVSVAFLTAIPWYVPLIGYAVVTLITRFVNKIVWQSPLLMMFMVTILGSLFMNALTYITLAVTGVSIPFAVGLVQVIIPSLLINLLLSLPIYAIAKDTALWAYPLEVAE